MQKKSRGRPRSPSSVRAMARQMAVSERMIYYSREIARSGREDLINAIQQGDMTVAAAVRVLRGTALPDRYDRLVLAWDRCSDEEQTQFLLALVMTGRISLAALQPEAPGVAG